MLHINIYMIGQGEEYTPRQHSRGTVSLVSFYGGFGTDTAFGCGFFCENLNQRSAGI